MGKIGFIFAGQGAQYTGMGKELYDQVPVCRDILNKANEELGIDLTGLCFEGAKEDLDRTENTQPAVLAVSIAALRALEERGVKADVAAGFSLGEYSALVCSGALSFEAAVKLVRKRGRFMQEAVPEGVGNMAAVLGLEKSKVLEACQEAAECGIVEAVNFNCPGQIVIAGEVKAVEKAVEIAKEKGALKAVILPVSAPFHSSMLRPASERLSVELEGIELSPMVTQVITNVNAEFIQDVSEVKPLLARQAMSPVLWENIIEKMIAEGVDTFIEIGPGRTLSGFVKKINRKVTALNVEDVKSLNKTLETMGVQ
jgi:[acyl-carrier-protein] S-malonyltransferase